MHTPNKDPGLTVNTATCYNESDFERKIVDFILKQDELLTKATERMFIYQICTIFGFALLYFYLRNDLALIIFLAIMLCIYWAIDGYKAVRYTANTCVDHFENLKIDSYYIESILKNPRFHREHKSLVKLILSEIQLRNISLK